MPSFNPLLKSQSVRAGVMIGFALLLLAAAVLNEPRHSQAASRQRQSLSFEDRVAAQRAIEEVYWRHRIWPKENPQPKPSLDEVAPEEALRTKVEDYLRMSGALEVYWQRPITGEQLQAEMERMARQTKQPDVLRELWAALGNDPLVIAECLARPQLVKRLARNWYSSDERFHGELKQRAEAELSGASTVEQMRQMSGEYHEVEYRQGDGSIGATTARRPAAGEAQVLDEEQWREQINKLAQMLNLVQREAVGSAAQREPTNPQSAIRNPQSQQLPVGRLSGLQEEENRFYAMAVVEKGADRLKVASVEWRKASFDEWWSSVRGELSAEASAPGVEFRLPVIEAVSADCVSETWTPTSLGIPDPRSGHTAVWTGSEMIIWGGGGTFSRLGAIYRTSLVNVTISPTSQSFAAAGGTGSVRVTTSAGCRWVSSSAASWITITSGSDGSGNGTVNYYVATNTGSSSRTGTLTIADQTFTLTQDGPGNCAYSIAPTNQTFEINGGTGSVAVTTGSGCGWTSHSNLSWITITAGSSGAGNGMVNYSVAPYPNVGSRTGAFTVAGQTFTVTQTDSNPAPTLSSLSPSSVTAGGSAFTLTINGNNFVAGSVVRWNGGNRPTAFVSDTQLTASIAAGDIAIAGTANITVFNPTPGGGVSNALNFTITSQGYEADVAPRPDGDGTVTAIDWVQIGRFVAGLDTAANGSEFQRADCAPREAKGDGRLTVLDWVQAGLYAVGEHPVVAAGGPTSPASTASARMMAARAVKPQEPRLLRVVAGGDSSGAARTVMVELDAQGDESALGFSLRFNPSQWRFVSAEAGLDARGAVVHVNANAAASGRIGFLIALPAGGRFSAGARRIVVLKFAPVSGDGAEAPGIGFADQPVAREIVSGEAVVLPARYEIKK